MCIPQVCVASSWRVVAPKQWADRTGQSAVGHCSPWAATRWKANSKCVHFNIRKCSVLGSKGTESHRVSNERLAVAALVLLLLAADVVEGEQQVMSLRQTGRKSQLHLLIEVWGPVGKGHGQGWRESQGETELLRLFK